MCVSSPDLLSGLTTYMHPVQTYVLNGTIYLSSSIPNPIPSAISPISINNNFFPLQAPKLKSCSYYFFFTLHDYNLL